jgi:hypothetical protein
MRKRSYWFVVALLLAAAVLSACSGITGGTGAAVEGTVGEIPDVDDVGAGEFPGDVGDVGDVDEEALDDTGAMTGTAATVAYTPVASEECSEIQRQLTQRFGIEFTQEDAAPFADLGGVTGESCQLHAQGTGVQFLSIPDAAQRAAQVLTENGWTADAQYAADSPTSTIGGLRRDNQLATVNVLWAPADGTICPADQPLAACAETLSPEQMNYTVTVHLAQQ